MWATVRANIIKYLANKHRLNNRNTLLSSVGGYSLTASTLYILYSTVMFEYGENIDFFLCLLLSHDTIRRERCNLRVLLAFSV